MRKIVRSAFQDIREGIGLRHLWIALASEDIGDQHRQTSLGPAWVLVNYLIYIGTFILIFGENSTLHNFIAYTSVGLFVFLFLQEVVSLGVSLYVREESFIAGTPLPMSVYVLRLTTQTLIRSGYTVQGCLAILLISGTPIGWSWLLSLVGVALILVTTPALIVVLATLGAFFPDAQFVVGNFMRVSMFLTPIFWHGTSGIRGQIYIWNPMTHFVDVVRSPIVDGVLPLHSVAVCIAIAAITWALAIFLLGRFRKKIVFLLT